MQKAESPQGRWRHVGFFLTALLVAAADQLTKTLIRSNLAPGESLPETGLLRLTHVNNTGAAFGVFPDQVFSLTIVALISIVLILLFVFIFSRRFPFLSSGLSKLALGLILGGTLGNLVDRLRLGHVTDFIDIGIWPSFNIADSCITVGTILFAYSLFSLAGAREH